MSAKKGTSCWRNEERCRQGVSTLGSFVAELPPPLRILSSKRGLRAGRGLYWSRQNMHFKPGFH